MGQYRDDLRLIAGLMGAGADPMQGLDMFLNARSERDARVEAAKAERQSMFGQLLGSGVEAASAGSSFPQIQAQMQAVAPALGAPARMVERATNRIENKVFPYGTTAESPSIFTSMWDADDEALIQEKVKKLITEDSRFLSDRAAIREAIRADMEKTIGPELYEQVRGNIDESINRFWDQAGGVPRNNVESGLSEYDRIKAERMGMTPREYEHRDDGWIEKWSEETGTGFTGGVGDVVDWVDDNLLLNSMDELSKTFINPDTGETEFNPHALGEGALRLGGAAALDLVGGPLLGKLGGVAGRFAANRVGGAAARLGVDNVAGRVAGGLFGLDDAGKALIGEQFGGKIGSAIQGLRTAVPGQAGLGRFIPGGNLVSDVMRGRSAGLNPLAAAGGLATGSVDNLAKIAGIGGDNAAAAAMGPDLPPNIFGPQGIADNVAQPAPMSPDVVDFGAAPAGAVTPVPAMAAQPLETMSTRELYDTAARLAPDAHMSEINEIIADLPMGSTVADLEQALAQRTIGQDVFANQAARWNQTYGAEGGPDWVEDMMAGQRIQNPLAMDPAARGVQTTEGMSMEGPMRIRTPEMLDAATPSGPVQVQQVPPMPRSQIRPSQSLSQRPDYAGGNYAPVDMGDGTKQWVNTGGAPQRGTPFDRSIEMGGGGSPYSQTTESFVDELGFQPEDIEAVAMQYDVDPQDIVRALNAGNLDPADLESVIFQLREQMPVPSSYMQPYTGGPQMPPPAPAPAGGPSPYQPMPVDPQQPYSMPMHSNAYIPVNEQAAFQSEGGLIDQNLLMKILAGAGIGVGAYGAAR